MLLILAVAVIAASVPLAGGSLTRLLDLRIHALWAVFTSFALQLGIVTFLPGGDPVLHRVLHFASYALAAWFIWRNRRIAGVPTLAAGGALNLIAIAANDGVMPASHRAIAWAGLKLNAADFSNSAPMAHPRLLPLGDILAWPSPLPLHNVFSVGDLVAVAGAALLLHAAGGSRLAARLRRGLRLVELEEVAASPEHSLVRVAGRGRQRPEALLVHAGETTQAIEPLPQPDSDAQPWRAAFAVESALLERGATLSLRSDGRALALPRSRVAAGMVLPGRASADALAV